MPAHIDVTAGHNRSSRPVFVTLPRPCLCPTRIGTIVAAALVVLHLEHHRTV
ncbi:hypothetical protein SAMN06264364_1381 [Quadrisphaera granulorum]|uniref:Uncharacterized protein n=1 Tax=Quadrisphaera granulorum TaxID=317664 RepID=A0A315ZQG8_9ACTN|nr:hypothetical protein BXY45_1381 [Quadrisphaera granulorum]SZE98800.1 hypothetical protein SAMN06264364_1381 [Quadrisphaera granulorum]